MEFDYENFYSSLEKVLRSWKKAEKAVKAWGQNGYKHNINTKTQCAGLIKKKHQNTCRILYNFINHLLI